MSSAIERFEVLVRHGAIRGTFRIDEFLNAFQAMEPSLHRHCQDPGILDVDALAYVSARLPENVHRIREFLVQADVPDKLPGMAGIERVQTPARRRSTFHLGDDIVIIVAREGVTELLDLVTLLTSYAIETYKVGSLLVDTPLLADLRRHLAGHRDQAGHNRLVARLAFQLGTTDDQLVRLDGLWNGELLDRVAHLVDHPPSLVVRLHRDYSIEAAIERSGQWARRIHEMLEQRLSPGAPVHILSSNLYSTVNLLSSFPRREFDALWAWGREHSSQRDLFARAPDDPNARMNLVYLILGEWSAAYPEMAAQRRRRDEEDGILELEDVFHVGVNAQAVDLGRLDPGRVDPRLKLEPGRLADHPLLLNFDYAFGEQAGIVVEQLFRHFSRRVESFSIMGKAGIVVGDRGGVMLPSYLLREGSKDVYDFPFGNFLDPGDFEGLDVGKVYSGGPMLTVLGTILQNDAMLLRYRDEWKILGLEMEGIPYIRALHQCRKLGFLREDLRVGVGYWASDAPLRVGETLSHETALQGLNATYAINIALLNGLLGARPVLP
ncbi:MAG: hypothetical protein AB1758_10970 [Candidatus Eremiobacterota bacterium]